VSEPLVAESLPELYRQVLDRVAALEQHDLRDEGALVRIQAIHIYSGPWTEPAQRRLRDLRIHAERVLAGNEGPRARRPFALILARLTVARSA